MAYVYRHIRLDKNVPFYIGVGKHSNYNRAYQRRGRNKVWNNIAAKTDFEIEIIVDELTMEQAFEKEAEFISMYKRVVDGGTLANMTLGGEGQRGMFGELNGMFGKRASEETLKKLSDAKRGKPNFRKRGTPMPQHVKDAIRQAMVGHTWNKGRKHSEKQNREHSEKMKGRHSGENHPFFGKTHSEESRKKMSDKLKGKSPWCKGKAGYKINAVHVKKAVIQTELNGIAIREFSSVCEAEELTGISKGSISNVCAGRCKTAGGFKWLFK